MSKAVQHLTQYAAYHRDRRNVATHFVGIPMIVLGTEALFARPELSVGMLSLTPALLGSVLLAGYYVGLDRRYGVAMGAFLAVMVWGARQIAEASTAAWLSVSLGLVAVGWIFQFVGHAFEGRKPAFTDDLRSLLIGPLFVLAEAGFGLGLRSEVREAIEQSARPPAPPAERGSHAQA